MNPFINKETDKPFRKKTILITGSEKGYGAELAVYLSKLGGNVVVNYLQAEKSANILVKRLQKLGSNSIAVQADVSNRDQVTEMMKKVYSKYRHLDILINNAGVFLRPTDWWEQSEENWHKTIDVNLKGVYECSRAAAPYLTKHKGSKIINMSTLGGTAAVAAYITSKIAVNHLTKLFAIELAPNTNVNAIAFSKIEIGMGKPDNSQLENEYIDNTPLNRLGHSSDIHHAVHFLASNQSDFITGHILVVDGGRCIRSL